VAAAIKKALKEMEPRLPEDVAYDVMYDTTVFVQAMIHKVEITLFEAFVLVGIVVFIFLGNLRATLIPIIAVPVALVGTFAVMLAMGFSANTVSLLALVLAIGIVVDDAIVVVEAVEHILETEPELTPAEATEKAMSQVTGPIIAITLVLLSVFVPTAFIPGITGQLYKQFAVAVSVSMIISAINALSLSPALCALLLRHRGHPRGLIGYIQLGIDKSRDGYAAVVRPLARRVLITGALVVAFALATGWLTKIVPTGFLPEEDQGAFFVEAQLPDAASLNRTNTVVAQVEKMIEERPWTQSVLTVSGYSLIDGLALPNKAIAIVGLKPFDERTQSSLSVFSALSEMRPLFQQIAAANVIAFKPAADCRARQRRRFRIGTADPRRCDTARPRGRGGRARHRRQSEPGARRRLHDLRGLDAAGLSETGTRARRNVGGFDRRHFRRIADHDGRYLRQ